MKKLIYSLSAFILGVSSANANIVASGTAQTVAANYYSQNAKKPIANATLAYTEKSATGDPVYYVFNMNDKEGFVIVSAEDAGYPIIGYSTEGNFAVPSATSNTEFNFWMEKRKSEIIAMRTQNVQADAKISSEWSNYINNKLSNTPHAMSTANTPLVQSTWNQNGGGTIPYNADCPGGSVTGCVATAMAQIMRYWGYPAQGTSSSSYTESTASGYYENYGTLSANYGATTYNWANMPLTSSNADVALISYHAGVSVRMDYSPNESGAMVCGGNPSALYSYKTYFKYDPSIVCMMEASYTQAVWIADLEAEFVAGRPVQYEGTDPSAGGHTWVCDGNDASDNMHMNWGWGGTDDGYYAVTNLVPPGQGIDFTTQLGGLFHIQPLAPTASLDAATFSISPPSTVCSPATFIPQVTIKNFGSTTMTSCAILYHLDNNADLTYNWNGSLVSYQSTTITLPTMTVTTSGSHTFTSSTSMPNGSNDANTSNDQMQSTLNVLSNTASAQIPYTEGFENPGFLYTDCFLTSNTGTQWNTTSTAAFTGSSSMMLDNFSQTAAGVYEFITPSIDMSYTTGPTMTFQLSHAQSSSSDADKLLVYTSTNCGTTWVQRYSKSGSALANAGVVTTAFDPSSTSQWRQETVSIPNVAGQADTRFKFQFTSSGSGNNIYIDDINISAANAGVNEEFANGFDLNIFPNPFTENTSITFNLLEKYNVSIGVYDIVGREIIPVSNATELSAGEYSLPLNRNTLKSGIYFVKLNVNGYSVTKKIVVQ